MARRDREIKILQPLDRRPGSPECAERNTSRRNGDQGVLSRGQMCRPGAGVSVAEGLVVSRTVCRWLAEDTITPGRTPASQRPALGQPCSAGKVRSFPGVMTK